MLQSTRRDSIVHSEAWKELADSTKGQNDSDSKVDDAARYSLAKVSGRSPSQARRGIQDIREVHCDTLMGRTVDEYVLECDATELVVFDEVECKCRQL